MYSLIKCFECGTETHNIYDYGGFTCPECGRIYEYEEGLMPIISEEEWKLLADARRNDDGRSD